MKSDIGILLAQVAEDKLRTDECIVEHAVGGVAGDLKYAAANIDAQHENGEDDLQAQVPTPRSCTRMARRLVEKA